MMSREVNIMVVANNNYITPMLTMFNSLFSNNSVPIRVFLLHSDFNGEFLDKLHGFFRRWEQKTLVPIYMEQSEVSGLPTTKELPSEIYYKMSGLDMLPDEIEKVLCMDLDMVITASLEELFCLDISDYTVAACKDIYAFVYGEGDRNIQRLDLPEGYDYFNAGLMYFNLRKIRKFGGGKVLIQYCYDHIELLKWPEQDILNRLFYDSYLQLPWVQYNCPPILYIMQMNKVAAGIFQPLSQMEVMQMENFDGYADYSQSISDNASIIHYIGESKPWRENRPSARTYELFDQHYLKYQTESI